MKDLNENTALENFIQAYLPWAVSLPKSEYKIFVSEVKECLGVCSLSQDYSNVGILLEEWRNTAEVWEDEELAKSLLKEIDENS